MVTKDPVPRSLLLPQDVPVPELEERTLRYAAIALLEHLSAKHNDVDDIAVQALVFNLQNLMRLYDRTTFCCDVRDGYVEFRRNMQAGEWEDGRWSLSWKVKNGRNR